MIIVNTKLILKDTIQKKEVKIFIYFSFLFFLIFRLLGGQKDLYNLLGYLFLKSSLPKHS